jgi:hypothetical protein
VITYQLMAPGTFRLDLEQVPTRLLDAAADSAQDGHVQFFGTLAVTPTQVALDAVPDPLTAATYSGVLTQIDDLQLSGFGLSYLLGTQDALCDVAEATVTTAAKTFANHILDSVLTQTGDTHNGITQGTLDAGVSTNDIGITEGDSRFQILNNVCNIFDKDWRVNPDATLDADDTTTLFRSNKVVLSPIVGGWNNPDLVGFNAAIRAPEDAEDFTTRTVVKPTTGGNGDASIASNQFFDLEGLPLVRERFYDNSTTVPGTTSANTVASRRLGFFDDTRRAIRCEIPDAYDPHRVMEPGDTVYIFDPDRRIYTLTNEVYCRGQLLRPITARIEALTVPFQRGMGVYFRDSTEAGTWIDLTRWVVWEDDPTVVEVGDAPRTLIPQSYSTNRN